MRRRPVLLPLPGALLAAALLLAAPNAPVLAQWTGLTVPPDGDNQKASVSQNIGLVRVSVDYSSPDVHGPNGEDRTGKIWGELVAYGPTDLGFGTCAPDCPWRGGANQNTVFTVSHDVQVQGKPLPAGAYGLHFYPGAEEWTVIFSKNSTSWGSFTYDPREDALRVAAKPKKSAAYNEWLTYEFTDRRPDRATLALRWENLEVPFEVKVADPVALYVEQMRRDLRNWPGFNWQNYETAARYALQNKVNLAEAEQWAQAAVSSPFGGQESFRTLATLAQLQAANGKAAEAKQTLDRALAHRTAGPLDVHVYARQLQAEGKNEEALQIFELNAKKNPGVWPTDLGLARGHLALGHKAEAKKHAEKALAQAPDEPNRRAVQALLDQLK
jgi:predicted negative regulator of RcsB-dependent stress response